MAPTIKLTFFDVKARGEPTRLALYIGGCKFEDERVPADSFAALKPELPFGMLPVINVDGTTYSESNAMLRYAGKLSDLYPKSETHALKVDMVVDALETVLNGLYTDKTKEGREKFVAEVIPQYMKTIDKMYADGKGPFLIDNHLTIADVKLMCTLHGVNEGEDYEHIPKGVLDKYKHVLKATKAVAENEKVKEWYAKKDGDEVKAEEKKAVPHKAPFFSRVFKRRTKKGEEDKVAA